MPAASSSLDGGFADPVFDAQSAFRTLMDAMARPASIHRVKPAVTPPAMLNAAAGAIACALIDADTPFWLDARLAESSALREWLVFHTGGRETTKPAGALFALVGEPRFMPALEAFAQGTQDYPDRSTTVILQLPSLEGGQPLTFAGPGIKDRATLAAKGLPADFAAQWQANRARFPRGVDLILTAGDRIACLPRSARLVPAEA